MTGFALSPAEEQAAFRLIETAFAEDLQGQEDLTTIALVPPQATGVVNIVARQPGVLAGCAVAQLVFQFFDSGVTFIPQLADGDSLSPGSCVAELHGPMRSLLTAERTALNFLTLLSGTATLTAKYVAAIQGTPAVILDTRKTLPGLRLLQKYAVRCGGGKNHRMGLHDAVLIKDNHLAWWQAGRTAAPSMKTTDRESHAIAEAVHHVRRSIPAGISIEVEVDTLQQLQDVLSATPDIVLLDNMSPDQLIAAVALRNQLAPQVQLEASGGVTLETVAGIARTGIERISVGALTHSAIALDIGFDWGNQID